MNNIVSKVLFLMGISLWVPGISLFNISGSWGFQIPIALCLVLLYLAFFKKTINTNISVPHLQGVGTKNFKWLTIFILFLTSTVLCTLFSSVGIDNSLLTAVVEMIGLLFSVTLSWWLCRFSSYAIAFFKGFRTAGFIFALYAVYQLVALPTGLPFSYFPMNNASFSLLDSDSAIYHVRALGLTPEPSILASLLIIVIGMAIVDLFLWPGYKQYLHIIVLVLGFLATSSQSIITLPIYILVTLKFVRSCTSYSRNFQRTDFIGISFLMLSGMVIFFVNPSIGLSLGRLVSNDSGAIQSSTARFNDFLVGLNIFLQNPIFGSGLGGYTDLASQVKNSLNLEGEAGASSSFLRLLCEQGFVGLISNCIIFIMLCPIRLPRMDTKKDSALFNYHICTLISILISMCFFVGYRNLYHLWLLIPLGLSLKARLKEAKVIDLDSTVTNPVS
jgi:hypothetical protein